MHILLLGSGGREHAFAYFISRSPLCKRLFIAPGNGGTDAEGTNLSIAIDDFPAIKKAVLEHQIELVIVGPEAPLVMGIRDFFEQDAELKNIPIVGPDKKGAQLEGSKDFSKAFMQKYGIPTAQYKTFTAPELTEALAYVAKQPLPIVLKADGLAAGKGVIIAQSHEEALNSLSEMLEHKKFGQASEKVVIEEFLDGIEVSVFVLTDGKDYVILPEAKDYKRIGEQDQGPNTGGMGAISPVPFADAAFMQAVEEDIIKPTLSGLQQEGIIYKGFIFLGLIRVQGKPVVIEYNARMGDPETQAVLSRLDSDLAALLLAAGNGTLASQEIKVKSETAATVVLVAEGYPEEYRKGDSITGFDQVENAFVFHAGTKKVGTEILSAGGRVMAVTALGADLEEAVTRAQKAAEQIKWQGRYFRRDIGQDLLALQEGKSS
jgi:phosphoribosylamine--glycine ligase